MNDSIKDMQKDIGYINKTISDLLNDFAHRNNCSVDIELTKHNKEIKGGLIRIHHVTVKAVYG